MYPKHQNTLLLINNCEIFIDASLFWATVATVPIGVTTTLPEAVVGTPRLVTIVISSDIKPCYHFYWCRC